MQTLLAVAELSDVVGVDALQLEAHHAAAPVRVCGPEDAQALDLGQALQRVGGQVALVGADVVHADSGEVVDRGAQADRLGDR